MSIVVRPGRYEDELKRLHRELREAVSKAQSDDAGLSSMLSHLQSISDNYGIADGDVAFIAHKRRLVLRAGYDFVLKNNLSSAALTTIIDKLDELGHAHPVHWIDVRSELIAKLRQEGDDKKADEIQSKFGDAAQTIVHQMHLAAEHLKLE